MKLTNIQLKLVSEFFSNMAVIWFGAAFISPTNMISVIRFTLNGIFSIIFAMIIIKGVK